MKRKKGFILKKDENFFKDLWFIVISVVGGFIFLLIGILIGWMIGMLIVVCCFVMIWLVWLMMVLD